MRDPSIMLVCAAIALAAIPVLIYIWYRNKRFLAESLPTSGVVIGLHEGSSKAGRVYAPIVRFTAADGRVIEFTDSLHSRPASFKVGDQVDVLYHRQKNSWARVSSPSLGSDFRALIVSGVVTTLLVFVCLIMAALSIIAFFVLSSKK